MTEMPEGYALCKADCDDPWILKAVAQRTGGFCVPCWLNGTAAALERLEVREAGRTITVPASKRKKRDRSRGRKVTDSASETARRRARQRLSEIYRDMYVVLLAQERSKLGLEPLPLEALRYQQSTTIDLDSVYRLVEQIGAPTE